MQNICRNILRIDNVNINNISYQELLNIVKQNISLGKRTIITYANANTLNLINSNNKIKCSFNKFDIIHPDGIGIFIASKILFLKKGFKERLTGSDFYNILIPEIIKNKWNVFFLGDTDETLVKISKKYPAMIIAGIRNGYDYSDEEIIYDINISKPKILIVGMGCPKQEIFISENRGNLNADIIIAVGEGIKIFAGNKNRGPKIIQILGLEWFVRLCYKPTTYFKRYIVGIPLFIYRIIQLKYR